MEAIVYLKRASGGWEPCLRFPSPGEALLNMLEVGIWIVDKRQGETVWHLRGEKHEPSK